jgi:hypothetical protein
MNSSHMKKSRREPTTSKIETLNANPIFSGSQNDLTERPCQFAELANSVSVLSRQYRSEHPGRTDAGSPLRNDQYSSTGNHECTPISPLAGV